jgi:diguanylate cyclase (GGDEF)-like protein
MESLMRRQATQDTLTGLPNRLLFTDRLQQAMHTSHRSSCPFYLLFLDLDGFKEVNDTLGHDRGDMLLKEVAARLQLCVRETDTVARLGGDEFAVLLMGIQQIGSVNNLVQEMLDSIALGYELVNERVFVSASIGITCFPTDGSSTETMLKNADQAMYSAKNAGKNCFRFFTTEMQQKLDARQRISRDLHSADIPNEFVLHYQPIIELATRRIHKAEALVRWQHPVNGLISPLEFIPIAEETGKISELGNWIFHRAIQDLVRWREQFDESFQVSINKSPAQFRNDMEDWNPKLDALGLPGSSVVIEITEGLLLEFTDTVKKKLMSYRDNGIEVALDDFGTGYSSLSYIRKLDIDYLKIDQSFVQNLESDPESSVLCEAIIAMAHKLGLKVIAEGIETEDQYRLLTEAECDYGQGYYFSKPLPLDAFESFLTSAALH